MLTTTYLLVVSIDSWVYLFTGLTYFWFLHMLWLAKLNTFHPVGNTAKDTWLVKWLVCYNTKLIRVHICNKNRASPFLL